ncbi:MAG: hypothetical protein ACKO2G_07460 [Verrucomicrobiales bacterium]
MIRKLFLTLFAGFALAMAGTCRAESDDGTVWAGLILGSSAASELGQAPDTEESKSVIERIGKVPDFRFPHYRVLGEHVQPLLKEYESWLVPSRGFFFKLDSRGPDPKGGNRVAVQLWREKEVLLKTDVVLKGDRPVIIKGPELAGHGRLILALRLVKK